MSLPDLPSFTQFFHAVKGFDPYPWQARLAEHVVAQGEWPATIGVPTGCGKTATLHVALYALAADARRRAAERRAPRRILMVVDRRTIVDQAYLEARALQERLAAGADPVLAAVAAHLRALTGIHAEDEDVVQIALLRGGIPRDEAWARRPDLPLIGISTVDQVGSRLLFRGYGVRPSMQSVHAGLLGEDALYLLDEVHLARPFMETLEAVARQWRSWRQTGLPERWQVVALSATSGAEAPFDLEPADLAHPVLHRRVTAERALRVMDSDSATHTRAGPSKAWVRDLESAARLLLERGRRCVGVVVNRVDVAQAVTAMLQARKKLGADVCLVTGRMRGHDRAALRRRLVDRAGPGWSERDGAARPFVCVSTQCIEAGADLDFDGMVTEVASLDAVVQRLGRVNRTGTHEDCEVFLMCPKALEKLDDPIYGTTQQHTRAWLSTLADAPLTTLALRESLPSAPAAAFLPHEAAAVLLPAHLDLLAQTGPVPTPSPEPRRYLHGLQAPRPEVSIVWRADVPDPGDGLDAQATARLEAVPPTQPEALALPIWTVKRWLARAKGAISVADTQTPGLDPLRKDQSERGAVAWRWSGERAEPVTAEEVRPGDTLVLPSSRGGLAEGVFDPAATTPVPDVGDLARTARTGRAVVRLDTRVYGAAGVDEAGRAWPEGLTAPPRPPGPDDDPGAVRGALEGWVAASSTHDSVLGQLLGLLEERGFFGVVVGGSWLLHARRRLTRSATLRLAMGEPVSPDEATTADDRSVVSRVPVLLDHHLRGVEGFAASFAAACGLPESVAQDVALAGRAHDLGKAHPGFKTLLYGGDPVFAAVADPLAKSGSRLRDRATRQRLRSASGLPRGFRHEMLSVAMLQRAEAGRRLLDEANDPDLVLHLVASHHGHARPFAPVEDHASARAPERFTETILGKRWECDTDHRQDRLDSGVADRFWTVQARYGWWGLAWLEAILRLADHRESELEEQTYGLEAP